MSFTHTKINVESLKVFEEISSDIILNYLKEIIIFISYKL